MNLQVNQNRQFYVANAVDANLDTLGDIAWSNVDNLIFMSHVGKGGITTTDKIDVNKILYANVKASVATKVQRTKIAIDSEHTLLAGQNYIVNIALNNFCNTGAENTYLKHGAVVAKTSMVSTTSQFYVALAKSIATNFYREMNPFVTVLLHNSTASTNETVTINFTPTQTTSGTDDTYDYIVLQGMDIDAEYYERGINHGKLPDFTVSGNLVHNISANIDEEWIAVTDDTANSTVSVYNSHDIADMEYFCMGERADQYRTLGNIPVNPTKYMVDENAANGYWMINIHYYLDEDNEGPQKSEKTLTIVADSKTKINAVLGAYGTSAATLNYKYGQAAGVSANLITQLS